MKSIYRDVISLCYCNLIILQPIQSNTTIFITNQLAEALRYKPKGRGFDGAIRIFLWHNPSGRTMALELTQPLTEINTKNISWGWGGRLRRPVHRADNPTTFIADCLEIWDPQLPGNLRACPVQYWDFFSFMFLKEGGWVAHHKTLQKTSLCTRTAIYNG